MELNRRELCELLGQKIIHDIRDEAIQYLQWTISGEMSDARSQRLCEEYRGIPAECQAVVRRFLVVAVDACLARCLNYLDENDVPLLIKTSKNNLADARKASDGLVGELYNESGWIARFSRFNDRIEPTDR